MHSNFCLLHITPRDIHEHRILLARVADRLRPIKLHCQLLTTHCHLNRVHLETAPKQKYSVGGIVGQVFGEEELLFGFEGDEGEGGEGVEVVGGGVCSEGEVVSEVGEVVLVGVGQEQVVFQHNKRVQNGPI